MGSGKSKDKGTNDTGRIWNMVILGMGGVGKSALTIQFVQDKFIKDYDPVRVKSKGKIYFIVEDSYRKQVVVDGKVAMLTIWDTAGQEEYEALQDGYIRDADGFIIVYSITNRKSFERIKNYHDKITRVKDSTKEAIVILGNKADLDEYREVTTQEGQKYAEQNDCLFFESSAKTKVNVEEGFHSLLRKMRIVKSTRRNS